MDKFSLNKLSDDGIPIPITHRCRPEMVGTDMTGIDLQEFGLALFTSYLSDQNFELKAINMTPENGAPNILMSNPQKALFYIWVKTDLAPNIPVYEPNETHDVITKISRQNKAILSFASITISCAFPEGNFIPKCGREYYIMLNDLMKYNLTITRSSLMGLGSLDLNLACVNVFNNFIGIK